MDSPIKGGYILLSRKLLKSGIMGKPPLYLKLWTWMLMQASYKPHGELKRGQFFTSLEMMREAMAYKVGFRKVTPTKKEIRGVCDFLSRGTMIVTTRVIHGQLITICNYDLYQTSANYEGHDEGHDEIQSRGTILTRKENKKVNNIPEEISSAYSFDQFRSRYPDEGQNLIDEVFGAISSTRKSGKVAESVLLAQLKKWDRYPVLPVLEGIKTYLEKDCAGKGFREEYLLGIIRNNKSVIPKADESWLEGAL